MNDFPQNPYDILDPNIRWAPSQEDLKEKAYEQLIPPLVYKIRLDVKKWRDSDYSGASDTTKALLNFWFKPDGHKKNGQVFRYYFAQREAIESIIYLYEVAKARDKFELMRFNSSDRISTGIFPESWPRYVIKMATGSGKTKVLSLALVWSYFHKLYETESELSRNFLIIAPNIIVLNRLRKDFDDLKIFREDPLIPENGYFDRDWQNDFHLTLHIQDELKPITEEGNLFLTNIHRVYLNEDREPSLEEEFLGKKPPADADTSKGMDLGKVLRSTKIKDLVVMNDEAHHIHDENMQWFKSIEDINNHLKLKQGKGISLQIDNTATPKHNNGAIFVQTICDYPLVEAIKQNIVKSPVLPDEASRAKLHEKSSSQFVERYKDYIHLGYIEWKKQFDELKNVKTPILFVMTLDTKEANQTKDYLEANYPEFKNSVLLIHTKKSGEISESAASKRDKEELEQLRKAADAVDEDTSPYKAVVSVMMLREGWDVRNVMTIVGLRPYGSPAKILPEQTLGRGLRKMFGLEVKEELVVVGTPAFIEFVESIKTEGVEFSYRPMGETGKSRNPIIVEIDTDNEKKDLDKLDIPVPVLSPRIHRDYKNLEDIQVDKMAKDITPVALKQFSQNELKEIVFTDIDGKFSHKIEFTDTLPDWRNVVGFFTQAILKESRLVSGFNILYPKVEQFIRHKLFGKSVNIEDANVLRNLSEVEAKQTLYRAFKEAIDDLTIKDKGSAQIKNFISLRKAKPLVADNQPYLVPQKSVFTKIIGDSQFELEFAAFLENCSDIISFAKNYQSLGFKIEYQGEDGNIHEFFPDFLIKQNERDIYIAETKGREDLDDVRKIKRLQVWCNDVNAAQKERTYIPLYVKQELWEKHQKDIKTFTNIIELFKLEKQVRTQ
ncbi:DEAD/DEAH box helicase family protein [Thermoflavifilum thermophilum]|uniref:Type III restriction enzyme n=1 Tax=Thermoflavifilum thermophilum TaxID=1393122 RepID=A0A1I7N6D3_9BACT|nr:DEAD/DEAH box helicase family protein [Thermoflavifilum thermophilum]SFV30238.1 type III restriction enzyme [Thermoflavifilum thermophilum]